MIALSSPLHVGIYEDGVLIEAYISQEQTSEALPKIFEQILSKYRIHELFYAKGPGSFMSIKISYIFLKTLGISLDVSLYATDGFAFNEAKPIKAMRELYFIKEEGGIITRLLETPIQCEFTLPPRLQKEIFDRNNEPLYILPAV